jgi:hypothetical protein
MTETAVVTNASTSMTMSSSLYLILATDGLVSVFFVDCRVARVLGLVWGLVSGLTEDGFRGLVGLVIRHCIEALKHNRFRFNQVVR